MPQSPATPDNHGEEKIQIIDGAPTITLGDALRFLEKVRAEFPRWDGLYIPYASVVEETARQAYAGQRRIRMEALGINPDLKLSELSDEDKGRFIQMAMTPTEYYDLPSPSVDSLFEKYKEDEVIKAQIELALRITRVKVKEALRIVFIRAFEPDLFGLETTEEVAHKNGFRRIFSAAMRSIGVEYKPIEITLIGLDKAPDGERRVTVEKIISPMTEPESPQKFMDLMSLKGEPPTTENEQKLLA
ncbi:hypothetical protein M0P48_02800 [Candidatus Gracilibacteria bacterium]|nr:hypothetical protein [Candidatus Gracilibacteria bacterium]